ncbi:MAG: efflux RND transporter periplasmic adaptor subunit [Dokdonella sp.]
MLSLSVRLSIASALLLAAFALSGCHAPAPVEEPPRVARVAQVEPAHTQDLEVYPGEVHARFESALGFRVSGKINTRHVDVGNQVRNGQVLAELDPRDLELARSSANATLASAQAALKLAASEYERYTTLRQRNFVSQFDLEAKTNALAAARAHVAEAQAALDASRNQAGYAELRADADGVITAISGEAGQIVGTGQTVITLAHDGASEVEISVPEQSIGRLKVGTSAQIELWTEAGKQHAGRIREIAPSADPTTRSYRVRVSFDDESTKLLLGQTARVYFASNGDARRFLIPLSAIYEKDGKAAIWQVDAKTRKVQLIPVEIVRYTESGALISDGLAVGDWIVTAGVHRLREGETINPIDALNRQVSF